MATMNGGMADSNEDDEDFVPHWEALADLLEQMEDRLYSYLQDIAARDLFQLLVKGKEYGPSWKSRGGAGAFHMLARKWDRLVEGLKKPHPEEEKRALAILMELRSKGPSVAAEELRRAYLNIREGCVEQYDLFAYAEQDERTESFLDDIGDLRRYLFLVEAEIRKRRWERIAQQQVQVNPTPHDFTSTPTSHDPTGMKHPFGFDPEGDAS